MSSKRKQWVYTSGEAAQICGVSADTVSRWFDLGQMDGFRLGPGGDRRIPADSLRKFMASHGIPLDRLDDGATRILVVDDDPYYLDIIPSILAKDGDYEVVAVSTGFDAGAQVADFVPHLIVLDIHLSDMDGRMVCERIKSRPDTRDTRVLAISGFIADDEANDLARFGFDDYLQKPFGVQGLLEKVHALLALPSEKVTRPKHARRGA